MRYNGHSKTNRLNLSVFSLLVAQSILKDLKLRLSNELNVDIDEKDLKM